MSRATPTTYTRPRSKVTVTFTVPRPDDYVAESNLVDRVVDELQALPGVAVTAVALHSGLR